MEKLWRSLRRGPWAIGLCGALCLGCGAGGARDLSLDRERARQELAAFLQAWQEGQELPTFLAGRADMAGHDPDWAAGKRLLSYELSDDGDDGTNAHFDAALRLERQPAAVHVEYVVGTSPVVSVFREAE